MGILDDNIILTMAKCIFTEMNPFLIKEVACYFKKLK